MINHYGEYIVYDMPKSNDLQTNCTHYMYMYQCKHWEFFLLSTFWYILSTYDANVNIKNDYLAGS